MLPSLCAAGRWASFWSFPGPISGCLPTPTLSLAWPSLGESHLLSPPPVMLPPPHPSSARAPSLARRSKALFFGRTSCLPRWAQRGGCRAQSHRSWSPRAWAGGRWAEGGWRGRGRVKARLSPPPEGVTAYKKGAALRRWGCRRRGRSGSGEPRPSLRPGTPGSMSEPRRRGRGRGKKHREGRKREREPDPGEKGRAPRRAQEPRFAGRNLPPAHPPQAPRG